MLTVRKKKKKKILREESELLNVFAQLITVKHVDKIPVAHVCISHVWTLSLRWM